MKKSAAFFAVALSLCACGRSGNSGTGCSASQPSADTASAVKTEADAAEERAAADTLRAVYAEVFAWYAKAESDFSLLARKPDFEARFMSSGYNALYRRVLAADDVAAGRGEIGFFDSDHWVCGQDFQSLAASVGKVSQSGPGKCAAEVVVTNCGTRTPLTVDLVKEGGTWKIDDLRTESGSEKARMREYLKAQ